MRPEAKEPGRSFNLPQPPTLIAILVVHRNDPEELAQTLHQIQIQNTSLSSWPVYVLDDHSLEVHQTELQKIIDKYQVRLIRSEAVAGKKPALKWFLPQLEEEFIIQTDADCLLNEKFLLQMAHSIWDNKAAMHVGRVQMLPTKNIWSRLAALDHLSLQLVTFSSLKQGKVVMASGASMAFNREIYLSCLDVGSDWAGGEDTFVAQAMAQAGHKIQAVPYASVRTKAPADFRSFIFQRLRWGSKSVAYPSLLSKALALSVGLLNVSLVLAFFLAPFIAVTQIVWVLWLYKMVGDALLMFRFTTFYGGGELLRNYLALALLYPFYISIIIFLSPFSAKGKWLGA